MENEINENSGSYIHPKIVKELLKTDQFWREFLLALDYYLNEWANKDQPLSVRRSVEANSVVGTCHRILNLAGVPEIDDQGVKAIRIHLDRAINKFTELDKLLITHLPTQVYQRLQRFLDGKSEVPENHTLDGLDLLLQQMRSRGLNNQEIFREIGREMNRKNKLYDKDQILMRWTDDTKKTLVWRNRGREKNISRHTIENRLSRLKKTFPISKMGNPSGK